MARARVVTIDQAVKELSGVIKQLEDGAFRVGDAEIEVPKQILLQTKFDRGDHQGMSIRLSWDIIEEEEVIEEDPEDTEWHGEIRH
ncbi:hypothetical protein GTO91_14010 [Heliobacterium undosum]|uniref:Amphi-Trp domain-containing protein n=1 Tax=Heliomicrobium undosum TaxID=121734 RepID=A0A845L6F4_9FIRM|nr:hypothetical protein [Heliomicrobium undosum]MZP30829.1 hypothetical protein [Heliomicrobium undosum]